MCTTVLFLPVRLYSNTIKPHLINLLKNMPKEPKHIVEAQRQRRKIREKSCKYSPGKVVLQVLGTGAKGAPRSLYVFSDQSRYLFNCGEGTQRLAHEHKMKLAKLEHIFITQPTWNNIGGLPGAALTIQDVGVPEITLHGPPGLEEIFAATRRFIVIKDLKLKIAECNETATFEDNVMKVKYVTISSDKVGEQSEDSPDDLVEDSTDYYAYGTNHGRKSVQNVSSSSKQLLKTSKKQGASMAYICQLQPRPGALCLDKCVHFGVPPGPLLGKLKSGEDVTLANGNVVKAADVCDPDDPGPIFIVVDCPSEDHLDSLISNESFQKYQSTATRDEDVASVVVHFTPNRIVQNSRYKQWIDQFSPSTQHVILNESNSCMGSISVHRIQYKLNLLSHNIFPLLQDNGTEIVADEIPVAKKLKSENSPPSVAKLSVKPAQLPYVNPSCLFNYHLRPKKGSDRSTEIKLQPSQFIEETMSIENFPAVLKEVTKEVKEKENNLTIRPFPRLLCLGTGSSIPNKTRNTSGMLLETDENAIIIMDCGEGTCGQIVRFYGQENSDSILSKIKGVYISHLHADHHLGLIGLLQGRRQAIVNLRTPHQPIFLIAPKQILSWLSFYDKYFEDIHKEYELISNSDLMFNSHQLGDNKQASLYSALNMKAIDTCYVRHCPNAFGVSFVHNSGYKITYSGDTMPSPELVVLGENSDLLVHEATMEDELADEAVVKMHSTTSQAINIGKKMNAKYTLLTHFSQRYAKLPRFNENFSENVGIAFDNMQIKLDELPLLPILYPALKSMFAEHYEELENKAAKRQLRTEREKNAQAVKHTN